MRKLALKGGSKCALPVLPAVKVMVLSWYHAYDDIAATCRNPESRRQETALPLQPKSQLYRRRRLVPIKKKTERREATRELKARPSGRPAVICAWLQPRGIRGRDRRESGFGHRAGALGAPEAGDGTELLPSLSSFCDASLAPFRAPMVISTTSPRSSAALEDRESGCSALRPCGLGFPGSTVSWRRTEKQRRPLSCHALLEPLGAQWPYL